MATSSPRLGNSADLVTFSTRTDGQLLYQRDFAATERQAVIEYMRAKNRACFVSPNLGKFITVYDETCERQDMHDLEHLAADLSFEFHCSALAALITMTIFCG
jgi:hypothetical protein